MSVLPGHLFGRPAPKNADPGAAPEPAHGGLGRRGLAAAYGLAVAGAAAPIAVSALAANGAVIGPPFVAVALAALLVVAPAGAGLAAALSGMQAIAAALRVQGGGEAEQAVLRIFTGTFVFFYALALAQAAPASVAVAALGLVAGWAVLLQVIVWPAAPRGRCGATMALDMALLSAFLHFGDAAAAGAYPLYLLATFYAGFRFGRTALWWNAGVGILGFAAVIVSTPFWREQPELALGLLASLAALPAIVVGPIGAIAAARVAAAASEADRRGVLRLIAGALRASPGAATVQIDDIALFAALEAGDEAAAAEPFDLRALLKRSLAPLQAPAAERGVMLRWRVDPHLPLRLRGRAEALARIVESVAEAALAAAPAGIFRIAFDAGDRDAQRVRLRMRADWGGGMRAADPGAADPAALVLVERIVARLGGRLAIEPAAGQRAYLTLGLTLAIDAGAGAPPDLAGCPVLIATADGALAAELGGMLAAWRGDARRVGDADAALPALAELGWLDPARRAVVIADGRGRLLAALGLAHDAARLGPGAPLVVLIADERRIDSLGDADDGEVDGFIPAPPNEALLAAALHALPFEPLAPAAPPGHERAMPMPPTAAPYGEEAGAEARGSAVDSDAERITPIAAHPRFVAEAAETVDRRAIDGLRALGGSPGFARDLIASFRDEARQIMDRLRAAAASGDAVSFARAVAALRRAADPVGGTQLGAFAASLDGLAPGELRQRGALHAQRLDAEIDRLADALSQLLPAGGAQRP